MNSHNVVWMGWELEILTHPNVVCFAPSSISRHRHHRSAKDVDVVIRLVVVVRWLVNGEGALFVRQIWGK